MIGDVIESRGVFDSTPEMWLVIVEANDLGRLWRCPQRQGDVDAIRDGIFESKPSVERWIAFKHHKRLS